MDNMSWGALALALTVLAGIWTWYAFRNRGVASGVRGVAITLLPIAAYLTHTLRMLGRVGSAVAAWATGFVFSPAVWVGVAMGVVAILLFVVSGKLSGRDEKKLARSHAARLPAAAGAAGAAGTRKGSARTARSGADAVGDDDDFSDIQAILKKHGIS